jgi:protein-S-isoprenylcysteine O-methyltransferase Ste14
LLCFLFPMMTAIFPVAAIDDQRFHWSPSSWGFALSLGSLWALIPAGLSCLVLILRTQWEDQTLQTELPGYKEYTARVRYKLLPGVW